MVSDKTIKRIAQKHFAMKATSQEFLAKYRPVVNRIIQLGKRLDLNDPEKSKRVASAIVKITPSYNTLVNEKPSNPGSVDFDVDDVVRYIMMTNSQSKMFIREGADANALEKLIYIISRFKPR